MSAPVIFAVGAINVVSSTTNTPAWPAHAAGDIGLLIVSTQGIAATLSTASGFTSIGGVKSVGGLYMWWVRATSSAMAAPVVSNLGQATLAQIISIRGCIPGGTPYEVFSASTPAGSTSWSLPSGSTSTNNSLVLGAMNYSTHFTPDITGRSNATLSGFSQLEDASNGAADVNLATFSGTLAAAGSIGTTAGTFGSSRNYVAINISFPDFWITPPVGGLVLAGTAPIVYPLLIKPNAGSLALTGQSADASQFNNPKPFAGSLALITSGAILARSGQFPTGDPARLGKYCLGRMMPGKSGTLYSAYFGSLNLTGGAVSLAQNMPRVPGTGSLVLTGAAPSIYLSVVIGAGSLAMTGAVPTVTQQSTVSPSTGSLALTGAAPVQDTRNITGAGALVTTTTPPIRVVVYRSKYPRSARLGNVMARLGAMQLAARNDIDTPIAPTGSALVLTGSSPGVVRQDTTTPSTAALNLAGQLAFASRQDTIRPNAGALVLAGAAPVVTQVVVQIPSAGALALTGQPPTVTQQLNQVPGAGSIVLAGVAPVLIQGALRTPAAGALTLTGIIPVVTRQDSTTAVTGTLLLAGAASVVTRQDSCVPISGVLAITGAVPTVTQQLTVRPNAGALTLTGIIPVVTRQDTTVTVTGALVLTGISASAATGGTVQPQTGTLVFAGNQVSVSAQIVTIALGARTTWRLVPRGAVFVLPARTTGMPVARPPIFSVGARTTSMVARSRSATLLLVDAKKWQNNSI